MNDSVKRLNELVEWYERFKPQDRVIDTGKTRQTVLRWGFKPEKRGGPIVYRGFELKTRQRTHDNRAEQTSI